MAPHVFEWVGSALLYLPYFMMGMVLAHVIFAAGVRVILLQLHLDDLALHIILGTLVGLAAPIAPHKLAAEVGLARALGFAG